MPSQLGESSFLTVRELADYFDISVLKSLRSITLPDYLCQSIGSSSEARMLGHGCLSQRSLSQPLAFWHNLPSSLKLCEVIGLQLSHLVEG